MSSGTVAVLGAHATVDVYISAAPPLAGGAGRVETRGQVLAGS